jgi:hypothetical protein
MKNSTPSFKNLALNIMYPALMHTNRMGTCRQKNPRRRRWTGRRQPSHWVRYYRRRVEGSLQEAAEGAATKDEAGCVDLE